ncbi:hypothetical protein K438DRAFT_1187952 [Mycena galopus ATCC 62051]|nr:hypothetical protein K438DRAFT_1187952 [Mycena galopus ATCC 62051]
MAENRFRALVNPAQKSQIRELLRSHLPPPAHLSSTVSALAKELARYDVKIAAARLQEDLGRLFAERADIQAHLADCNSLFAPIRRLPSEILVDIFGVCWQSFQMTAETGAAGLATAMSRLAHAPLLALSQVCIRWYNIALGTPALWRYIDLAAILWTVPAHLDSNMKLLGSALERSRNHLIAVTIKNIMGEVPHPPAFDLVTQHSERWEIAHFLCDFSNIFHLSGLKGRLPNLHSLRLYCWGSDTDAVRAMEIFHDLPCLRSLEFTETRKNITTFLRLPWEQLAEVHYVTFGVPDVESMITAVIPRLSRDTTLSLHMVLRRDHEIDRPSSTPSVRSDLAALDIHVSDFSATTAREGLEMFLASLTLPSLTKLAFVVGAPYPHLPLPWPNTQFFALSERSCFHSHLNSLHLYDVTISEQELLHALDALPALKQLSISDHERLPGLDGTVDQVLVSDTVLAALTRAPNSPCLVPDLIFFDCQSTLHFNDQAYLDCVLSRVVGLRGADTFECELWWLPGHQRELDPTVLERIHELRSTRKLSFFFAEAEEG